MERLIDLAARRHGFDRVELRRRNLVPAERHAVPQPVRHALRQRRLRGGDGPRGRRSPTGRASRRAAPRRARRGRYRGIGVANYIELNTGIPRERAEITVRPEGRVDVVLGTLSSGQGHETSFAQLVVEWLGVRASTQVRLITGDTDIVAGRRRHAFRPRACGSARS